MQSINAIQKVTAKELQTAIFGDKKTEPFQIKLLRTSVAESADSWNWSVSLPLANREIQNLFKPLILRSLQITNDELPAALVITAYATNVGYEPRFQLINCTFLKRGMRRLRKAFAQTMERWNEVRHCITAAWKEGGLQTQAEVKAMQLCQCEFPHLVDHLRVRIVPVESQTGLIAFIKTEHQDELLVFDFDRILTESGFRSALQRKLEIYLRGLVRKGMAECLNGIQEQLLGESPALLLKTLQDLGVQRDLLEYAGIPMAANPLLPELMSHLREYIEYKKRLEYPGVLITFSVYNSDELIGKCTRSDNVIKIGRTPGADVVLIDNASVPRIHSVIEQHCGRVTLIELAAGLPTYINGEPLTGKGYLHNGDEIGVGDAFRIKVEFQESLSDDISDQDGFTASPVEISSPGTGNLPS